MHKTNDEHFYSIENSNEVFDSFIKKEYLPEELQNQLYKKDILIIPTEGFRAVNEPLFPVGTEKIYLYLLSKGLSADICISDEDYKELALHGDLKRFGKFVVKKVAFPVFLTVLTTFISNEIITRDSDSEIKLSITVIDSTSSKRIEYEGPAEKFIDITDDIKEKFWEE